MPRIAPLAWAVAGVLWHVFLAAPASAAGLAAHRIVAQATVEALPAPLNAFYASRVDAVLEYAQEPDAVWRLAPRYAGRECWHYLHLDAAARDDSLEARLEAARAFPLRQVEARRLFREHGVMQGGELIWRLADLTEELAEAFRRGDHGEILRTSGHLAHFALDAATPFAATRDSQGKALGNPILATAPLGDPLFAHQDVSHRVTWELIRRNAERYRAEIRPEDVRFELQADPAAAALACLIESLAALEPVCRADREILQQMGVSEPAALLARTDEFYPLLDARCGEYAIAMLQRGTRLATTLIVCAWEQAGRPDLSGSPVSQGVAASAPPRGTDPNGETSAGGSPPVAGQDRTSAGSAAEGAGEASSTSPEEFLASKSGKVYHRADCPHAARISPGNLVRFKSRAEAERSGRRACRACKPDEPAAPSS